MLPADERLKADDFVARRIDARLIVELELAGNEGLAQVAFHGAPRLHLLVHLRLEKAVPCRVPSPLAP